MQSVTFSLTLVSSANLNYNSLAGFVGCCTDVSRICFSVVHLLYSLCLTYSDNQESLTATRHESSNTHFSTTISEIQQPQVLSSTVKPSQLVHCDIDSYQIDNSVSRSYRASSFICFPRTHVVVCISQVDQVCVIVGFNAQVSKRNYLRTWSVSAQFLNDCVYRFGDQVGCDDFCWLISPV